MQTVERIERHLSFRNVFPGDQLPTCGMAWSSVRDFSEAQLQSPCNSDVPGALPPVNHSRRSESSNHFLLCET